MPLAGIVTLIAVGLVVAALAIYLIWVALLLRRVSFNLGTIIAGLHAIAFQAEPLGRRLQRINGGLESTRQTLQQFLEQKQRESQPRPAPAASPEDTSGNGRKAAGRKATGRKSTGRKSTGRRT